MLCATTQLVANANASQQKGREREDLRSLQLVHVSGLAHAQVFDGSQHFENEPRCELVGPGEDLCDRIEWG